MACNANTTAPPPPIDVLSLDELGVVLGFLPLEERCTVAPLVCKSFYQALRANGDLYARLAIDARRAPAASSAGLAAWVARRAGRVQALVLTVPPCAPGALPPGPARAVATAVGACASPLPLRVPGDTMFGGRGPAAPPEPPLREVVVECRRDHAGGGPAHPPPLGPLGALPPALAAARCATSLTLRASRFECPLPPWIGDLVGLETLTVAGAHPPEGPGAPAFFPVQMLALSRLTRLEVLAAGVRHDPAEAQAQRVAGLAALLHRQGAVAERLAAIDGGGGGLAPRLPPPPPPPDFLRRAGIRDLDAWPADMQAGMRLFLAGVRAQGAQGGGGGGAEADAAAAVGAGAVGAAAGWAAAAAAAAAAAGAAPLPAPPPPLIPVDGDPLPRRRRQAHPQPRGGGGAGLRPRPRWPPPPPPPLQMPEVDDGPLPPGWAGLGVPEDGEDLFDGGGGGGGGGADHPHPAAAGAAGAAAVAAQAARLFAGRPGRVVVPPVLGELPALRALAIRGADGVSFHPAAFQRGAFAAAGLADLALTDCGLVAVPHQVTGMAGLTSLDVSGNRGLSSLPPLLAPSVRGLRSLSAAGCDLARLPPALTRLTALTALDLSDNPRLQVGGGDAPAPLAAARRDVSLAQLLAALPALATLDLRSGAGPNGGPPLPKRWSASSLAQLCLVGAPPGYGGEAVAAGKAGGGAARAKRGKAPAAAAGIAVSAPSGALRWGGTLLLPRAAAAPAPRVGVARRASAGSA